MKLAALLLILPLLLPLSTHSQCKEVRWPEDPEKRGQAENFVALYTDEIKSGNLDAARGPLSWMFANNPDFNESLYINGIKVYNEILESSENAVNKQIWFDSLMLIYDQRISTCGDHSQLYARKAYDAYKHTIRDQERLPANLELFDMAFRKYGSDIGEFMLLPYINLAQYNFKSENITEQELTERYDKIKEIINLKSQNGELENKENISETVDDIYYAAILGVGDAVDCELIKEKLGPRLESNPSDLKLAKQIFSLMVSNKCTEDPLWMYTAEIILENEPDYGLYKILGQKSMSTGELDKAQENLSKAAELADNAEEKSEIYLLMGSLKEKSGAKAEARSWYQKALQEGSSEKDAYNALGYLYYRSSEDCMEKENIVRDRAIFILAYEMFVKAGNTEMAAQTKEQFPSKEEIFLQNYSAGDPIDIRCWVRREVNLQTRD